jgi:hypothetical protein
MVENNSWVTSLKLGIENGEDLEKSKAFKEKAKIAGDATEAFVKYGKQLTEGRAPASAIPGFSVGDFIKALVENGIIIWKAYKEQEKAERDAQATATEKELKWSSWEQLKPT